MTLPEQIQADIELSDEHRDLSEHIGDRVRVDVRPKERQADGTIKRYGIEDIERSPYDPLVRNRERMEIHGESITGELALAVVPFGTDDATWQLPDDMKPVGMVHFNPVLDHDRDPLATNIHVGASGWAAVKVETEHGPYYDLVEKDDIELLE